jgi:single-stranded DNA-binding protein
VVWGKRAEGLAQHLTKGKKVMVAGETRTRSWEGDDGQTRYRQVRASVRTEVHVTPYKGDVVLLGGGQRTSGPDVPAVEREEDIPF